MLILDDLIIGTLKGYFLLEKNLSKTENIKRYIKLHIFNSLYIWLGLFTGNYKQIISRFTWEILQTVIGFIISHFTNIIRVVECVEFHEGSTVLLGGGWRGSISLGTYILLFPGNEAGKGKMLFMHEFGHTLQSRLSGPLYLFKYGIPSILTDNYSWMEQDANLRSAIYFAKNHKISLETWQRSRFCRLAAKVTNPNWWEYLLLLLVIGFVIIPVINYKKGI